MDKWTIKIPDQGHLVIPTLVVRQDPLIVTQGNTVPPLDKFLKMCETHWGADYATTNLVLAKSYKFQVESSTDSAWSSPPPA